MTNQDAADLLNEMFALDPDATQALVEARVACNNALTDHPTIPVWVTAADPPMVGLLGVVNGLLAKDGQKKVHAKYGDYNRKLLGFGTEEEV